MRVLSSLFSIDLCSYAVMSNHYHLVVKINAGEAISWSDEDVLNRWTALFRGPLIVQQYRAGEPLTDAEADTLCSMVKVFRSRLQSLSWFMKCLNEYIARKANAEDGCTGHFWEARFHSESLCSEQALIAAMAYVDLNPIRARMAKTPAQSGYTSIKARIDEDARGSPGRLRISRMIESAGLFHFSGSIKPLKRFSNTGVRLSEHTRSTDCLPMYQSEYLKLVDATGRMVVEGRSGRIDPELETILSRIVLSEVQWHQVSTEFRHHYRGGYLRLSPAA